jgi:hypothetical protein
MKQKIKSFISLKATSAMFGLLFFIALAGGMAINVPNASAVVTVNTQPVADFTSGTYKADAVFSVVKFGITQDAGETLSSVAVTIVAEDMAVSGDFASLKVYKEEGTNVEFQSGEDTLIGTEVTVNVGSITTIDTGATTIGDTETTFYVVTTIAASPTDTNAFSVDVAADGIIVGTDVLTTTALDGATIATIDTTAPVMTSAIYKDTDDNGTVDEIVVTYSEDIAGGSTFIKDEWSFDPNPRDLAIDSDDSGSILLTDVQITVVDSENGEAIDGTIIKYTAGTGIVDGAGNYAEDGEFPISVEEEEDDEDEDFITPPEGSDPGPAKPNLNSGVTLYRMEGSPRVYVIKNKKKHWIQTPKEFNAAGYNWGKVKVVSPETLEEYPDDEETSTIELLRAVGSYKVYKIDNGKKRWIKTAGEFNAAGYKWKNIKEVSPEALASYQNEVLSELLRAVGDYKVYKLKGGKKYWVRTIGEFNAAGYKWEDVEEVTAETLDDYPNSDSDPETT